MSRAVAKVSPKKPAQDQALSKLPLDPERCRARWWNLGFGAQCWRLPGDNSNLCRDCQKRKQSDADWWGLYDTPFGQNERKKQVNQPHPWKATKQSPKQKKSVSNMLADIDGSDEAVTDVKTYGAAVEATLVDGIYQVLYKNREGDDHLYVIGGRSVSSNDQWESNFGKEGYDLCAKAFPEAPWVEKYNRIWHDSDSESEEEESDSESEEEDSDSESEEEVEDLPEDDWEFEIHQGGVVKIVDIGEFQWDKKTNTLVDEDKDVVGEMVEVDGKWRVKLSQD